MVQTLGEQQYLESIRQRLDHLRGISIAKASRTSARQSGTGINFSSQ